MENFKAMVVVDYYKINYGMSTCVTELNDLRSTIMEVFTDTVIDEAAIETKDNKSAVEANMSATMLN